MREGGKDGGAKVAPAEAGVGGSAPSVVNGEETTAVPVEPAGAVTGTAADAVTGEPIGEPTGAASGEATGAATDGPRGSDGLRAPALPEPVAPAGTSDARSLVDEGASVRSPFAEPRANDDEAAPATIAPDVLRARDVGFAALAALFAPAGLALEPVADGEPIPGSHWGDDEAGLIGLTLHARADTPVHSVLHEGGHWLLMDDERRARLHTDAGGSAVEENAVCCLQILLADRVPGMGRARMLDDMDRWGYSFRLGSAARWFVEDAEDARARLRAELPRLRAAGLAIDPDDRRITDRQARLSRSGERIDGSCAGGDRSA